MCVCVCAIPGVLSHSGCHGNNRQSVSYLGVSSDHKYVSLPFRKSNTLWQAGVALHRVSCMSMISALMLIFFQQIR